MKLIIREYLAALRERDELDAILPDLLSEGGFVVYSRPQRGTTQYGVDVAAVGPDEDGTQTVFLFCIKPGDLTRAEWHRVPQGVRASLDQIRDAYISSRVPSEYRHLKIAICVCIGGDVQEQVRQDMIGYFNQNTTERISYKEWNGDKLADMLLRGILREEILPKSHRSSFQKAVAMVDQPEISYRHFENLVNQLTKGLGSNVDATITAARQIYICLWIVYVWARDIDNLETPYRLSELCILRVWDLLRPYVGKGEEKAEKLVVVLHQLIPLHITVSTQLFEGKIFPHVEKRDAISLGVTSRHSVDVNLKLFELLGRIALTGLWVHWFESRFGSDENTATQTVINNWNRSGFQLINNNRALFSPIKDDQIIEVVLFLMLSLLVEGTRINVANWLSEMVNRINFAVRTRGKYPCTFTDYRDLIGHPSDRDDSYFEEATAGSVLVPTLAAWLCALGDAESVQTLAKLYKDELEHSTLQLWLPDEDTEESIYRGGEEHGVAFTEIPILDGCEDLLSSIIHATEHTRGYLALSAIKSGYWPIFLMACRHFRHPIPPQFWIELLRPPEKPENIPQK